jgi:SAM-dependent methyltransferase
VRRVAIDDSNKDRYRRFSESKYGGLLDDWMEELQPEIVFCKECGHHWYLRQPSPEQLSFMYANGRPLSSGRLTREPNQEMVNEMSQLAKLTGKMHPRLLDFGSGFGRWARAAARTGFDVYAYEPIKVRGAESVDEFTLVHDLSEIAGMQFDAVNLEQVLEHIPDPIHTLQTIKSFFSEDTILRVRVPNIFRPPEGSCVWTDWPYDGIRVHAMAPFEHLHGFTPRSLVNVIERSGYELIPLKKIWRNYPVLVARNLAGKIYPKVGQTMALAKLIN